MQVSTEVMTVLEAAKFVGHNLYLNHLGTLDRKLYTDVNKVLEAMGGKWHRGEKAHIFEGVAFDAIEDVLQTGEYHRVKQDLGQFDTPASVVVKMLPLANIQPGMMVLEPSAGLGNLVGPVLMLQGNVTAFELDPKRADICEAKFLGSPYLGDVTTADFLSVHPMGKLFDVVLMNPPFAKQVDIDHVYHASKFLKPGGRLVSVMSASVTFRENDKTALFRQWVKARGGTIEMLPDGAFAESGTQVRACIVAVNL